MAAECPQKKHPSEFIEEGADQQDKQDHALFLFTTLLSTFAGVFGFFIAYCTCSVNAGRYGAITGIGVYAMRLGVFFWDLRYTASKNPYHRKPDRKYYVDNQQFMEVWGSWMFCVCWVFGVMFVMIGMRGYARLGSTKRFHLRDVSTV